MSTAPVHKLSGMFPSLGTDVIAQVLRNTNNNLERAVDMLLAMSNGGVPPATPYHPSQSAHSGQWQKVGRAPYTTPASAEQSWPLLQTTRPATTGIPSYSNSPQQNAGIPSVSRFAPSNSTSGHHRIYSSDPQRWAHQQQLYVTQAMPQPNLSNKHTGRETGLVADQGWPLLHPAGSGHSKPKQVPLMLQRQNGGAGMNPNFGTVKVMIMLRGLPGSGKSTLARQLVGVTGIICCTDDFFMDNGRYIFDPTKLGENHQKNQDKARQAMEAGMTPVIIDNTNTTAWEMKPYIVLANALGYKTQFLEPQTDWKFSVEELERRNSHGVTRETLMKMLSRYEHDVSIQQVLSSTEPPRNNRSYIPSEQYRYRNGQGYRSSYYGQRNKFEMAGSELNQHYHSDSRYLSQSRNGQNNPPAGATQQVQHATLPQPHSTVTATSSSAYSSHSQSSSSSQSSDPSDLASPSYSLWSGLPLHKHSRGLGLTANPEKTQSQPDTTSLESSSCNESPSTAVTVSHDTPYNQFVSKDCSSLLKLIKNPDKKSKPTETSSDAQVDAKAVTVTTRENRVSEDFGDVLDHELDMPDSPNPDCFPPSSAASTFVTDHHRLVAQESDQHFSASQNNLHAHMRTKESDRKFRPYVESEEKYTTTGIREYGFTTGSDTSQISLHLPSITSKCSGMSNLESGSQPLGRERTDSHGDFSASTLENELTEHSDPPSTPLGSLTSSEVLEPSPNVPEPAVRSSIPPGFDPKQSPTKNRIPLSSSSPTPQSSGTSISPPQAPLLMPSALDSDIPSPIATQLSPPQPVLTEVQSDEDSDKERNLKFLSDCFPMLKPAMVQLWYQRHDGDIQSTVDMILHLPQDESDESNSSYTEDIMSMTTESTGPSVDVSLDESQEDSFDHAEEWPDQPEASNLLATESENKEPLSEEVVRRLHLTDEQYAQLLQEHINVEEYHKQQEIPRREHQEPPQQDTANDAEAAHSAEEIAGKESEEPCEDTNLELRLTLSLANQLQKMFGSVTHLLPFGGEIQSEDLLVLLSERAAREIYVKWTDTLMARKVEYEVLIESAAPNLAKKEMAAVEYHPTGAELSFKVVGREKKRKRKGKEEPEQPLPAHFGEKQKHNAHKKKKAWKALQPISQEEVDQSVKAEAEKYPYIGGTLKELYERFPSIGRPVIHCHFYRNGFKYDGTVVDLLALVPSTESTDGNCPSRQSGYYHINPSQHSAPCNYSMVSHNPRAAINYGNVSQQEEMEYADLRAEAAVHAQLRNEAFQKASAAYAKKQGELAGYYAAQGHRHTEKMKEANRRAAAITFRQKNRERPQNTLDLHMLHVDEALGALHDKLEGCSAGSQLFVITGRGSHSKGAAKLKPAVENYLKSMGKRYIERNPGMLEITI